MLTAEPLKKSNAEYVLEFNRLNMCWMSIIKHNFWTRTVPVGNQAIIDHYDYFRADNLNPFCERRTWEQSPFSDTALIAYIYSVFKLYVRELVLFWIARLNHISNNVHMIFAVLSNFRRELQLYNHWTQFKTWL